MQDLHLESTLLALLQSPHFLLPRGAGGKCLADEFGRNGAHASGSPFHLDLLPAEKLGALLCSALWFLIGELPPPALGWGPSGTWVWTAKAAYFREEV